MCVAYYLATSGDGEGNQTQAVSCQGIIAPSECTDRALYSVRERIRTIARPTMLGRGFYVSPRLGIFILVLFVMVVLSVGLMAGFIPDRKSDCEEDGGGNKPEMLGSAGSFYGNRESGAMDDQPAVAEAGVLKTADPDQPWLDPFLPKNLKPTDYTLWFYPDFYFDASTYWGRETIRIEILEETRFLIIHYKEMDITNTTVKIADGALLELENVFGYDANQFWVVETKEPMAMGLVVDLMVEFTSSLTNGIVGYYKSTYVNALTGIER